jgi:hypothetical protein
MKNTEVPQEDGGLLEGKFKTLKYAIDEDGNYVEVQSIGWEPETIVLNQAWEEINEQASFARQKVEADEWSPLAFHATMAMMDDTMLAEYMGISKQKVREHMHQPKVFKSLSMDTLLLYAEVLNVPIEKLIKIE